MADEYPRVEDLMYHVRMADGHLLAENASLEGELIGFRFKLDQKSATFYPLEHYATEAEARAALEPQLKAWEIDGALRHGRDAMRFKFLTSFVQPEAPRPGVAYLRGIAAMAFTGRATLTITHAKHPAPPKDFAVDDCVEDLAALFVQSRESPGGLLKDVFSMVSRLEFEFGGLPAAAGALQISEPLLRYVRRLSTTRGTGAEVRKFETNVPRTPLTTQEREWLSQVLVLMVRRAGAVAAGAPVGEQITLETMPIPSAS